MDEAQEASERLAQAELLKPCQHTVHLLGRVIPLLPAPDGTMRANENGKPMSAQAARGYIARAFGDRLGEVSSEMAALPHCHPTN
jgi:hypothetical protein